jgi:hypothetical protein
MRKLEIRTKVPALTSRTKSCVGEQVKFWPSANSSRALFGQGDGTSKACDAQAFSTGGMIFGLYLLLIGVNYVPMLIHAISIVNDGTARDGIEDELDDKQSVSEV